MPEYNLSDREPWMSIGLQSVTGLGLNMDKGA